MRICRSLLLAVPIALSACSGEIYLRDGVTDGDTFYLADRALTDSDPALQSWVSYSLTRSTCQLQIGGLNPARESSFDCELTSRRLMLDTWSEKKAASDNVQDDYLDTLADVRSANYLDEYVAHYFDKPHWELPADLDVTAFDHWRRDHLRGHKPQTRITGSWNYARNVSLNP